MTHERVDHIKGVFACGILLALVASAFNASSDIQAIGFAFGVTYGGLWLQHD